MYDGSVKTETRNYSLNDCLLTGPNLIPQIFKLLLKFRQNPIGLVADIEKAFLMIGINEEDGDMPRFLWLKDAKDPHSDVLKLRFCRLVFGLPLCPAILGATIQHHLEKHEKQKPEIVEHLKKPLYVDDFVSGAKDDERAVEIYKGSKQLMSSGGFNLRKWNSNSDNLVKAIEALEGSKTNSRSDRQPVVEEDLSFVKATVGKESNVTEPTLVKVLGTAWDTVADTFLLSPFTIKLKILFKWDGELQGDLHKQCNALITEFMPWTGKN